MSERHITLTHLNIRESISILISKLILVDIVMAVIVVGAYYLMVNGDIYSLHLSSNPSLFLIIFGVVGIIKISLGCWIVLEWLNEYYEITPEYIVYKRGVIFKNKQQFRIDHTRMMRVIDSLPGEIFNYGTISLYDLRLNKYLDMYMIHNPERYAQVLKTIRPTLEIKTDKVWLPWKKPVADDQDEI
jgi:hypothetical protein